MAGARVLANSIISAIPARAREQVSEKSRGQKASRMSVFFEGKSRRHKYVTVIIRCALCASRASIIKKSTNMHNDMMRSRKDMASC